MFYKRLSDVYDDEAEALAEQFGDRAMAREVIAEDHADALRSGRPPIVRFFVPEQYSWWTIRNHGARPCSARMKIRDAPPKIARR